MFSLVCRGLMFLGFAQIGLVSGTKWVDDLTESLAKDSEFRQVKLMTRIAEKKDFKDPVIDELFVKLIGNVPALRVDSDKNFRLPSVVSMRNNAIDTSATLYIFVIESRGRLPIGITEKFLDIVAEMADHQIDVKYLIVASVGKATKSLEELLLQAWIKNKMLHLTIVEVTNSKTQKTFKRTKHSVSSLKIHRVNPFKKEYTKLSLTPVIKNLFPSKDKNFWGHPMTVNNRYRKERPEYDADFLEWFMLQFIIEGLNTSPQYVTTENGRPSKSDDLIPEFYYYTRKMSELTTPIITEGVYFLVPVIPRTETYISTNFSLGFLLICGVIMFFWGFMRLLGEGSYCWRPFNIVRVFFGVSIRQQPYKNVERIIFACLLTLCAFYSSTIYGAITEVTWHEGNSEIEFESFEDLAASDLAFLGNKLYLTAASHVFVGPLNVSMDRFSIQYNTIKCAKMLIKFKNVSCLLMKNEAMDLMAMFFHDAPRSMKLAKPRLLTVHGAFLSGERSIYRSSVDRIIMRMQSAGFIEKIFYQVGRNTEASVNRRLSKESENTDILLKQLIAISVIGYSLSLIVFLGEIIVHRISNYIKSKKRPLPPSLPAPRLTVVKNRRKN